jgi:galactokinase
MIRKELFAKALEKYMSWYGDKPQAVGYAPGRVEILGNHTDYNEGYVLSAAINFGAFFLASPTEGDCRIVAGDLMEEASFPLVGPAPKTDASWPNYVMGVAVEMALLDSRVAPFTGLFFSDVPLGSGLSSSAALEVSTAMAIQRLYGTSLAPLELAKIGQKSEHDYVGANTGLMDQFSSLHGKKDQLVISDFRNLTVGNVPLSSEICFLVCDTGTKHSLGESDYNVRRQACERSAAFFAENLSHPVSALRDVSMEEWQSLSECMNPEDARRSAHVVGENTRVLQAQELLEEGKIEEFGLLMFESHDSSRYNFENSCRELDVIVDAAVDNRKVLGARLSGGGFGGSAVLLLRPEDVDSVIADISGTYRNQIGTGFKAFTIDASDGANAFTYGEVN